MAKSTLMSVIRTIRQIAACTLLGAVTAGAVFGWVDHAAVDPRTVGAGMGALAGVGAALLHIL